MFPAALKKGELDSWVLAQRPPRNALDPRRPYGSFLEWEPSGSGELVPVATILLTNRECPWKCIMCDLWKNTLPSPVAPGDIPAQIDHALALLPSARHIKLYNSGSFFDQGAIPVADYPAIANRLQTFDRVVVESHPALISEGTLRFRDLLPGRLEIAIGLETANPSILAKLNKGMTLSQFSKAAAFLQRNGIALRTFLLVTPPFLPLSQALSWVQRSLEFSFHEGATAASLIPTRGGNGAMEALQRQSLFTPTPLALLEAAHDYGIALRNGRVFADLWDLPSTACSLCFPQRRDRLQHMNLHQALLPAVACSLCGTPA